MGHAGPRGLMRALPRVRRRDRMRAPDRLYASRIRSVCGVYVRSGGSAGDRGTAGGSVLIRAPRARLRRRCTRETRNDRADGEGHRSAAACNLYPIGAAPRRSRAWSIRRESAVPRLATHRAGPRPRRAGPGGGPPVRGAAGRRLMRHGSGWHFFSDAIGWRRGIVSRAGRQPIGWPCRPAWSRRRRGGSA